MENREEWQYELIFPREVNGSALLSSSRELIILMLTYRSSLEKYPLFFSRKSAANVKVMRAYNGRYLFEFRPQEMTYNGKLEY